MAWLFASGFLVYLAGQIANNNYFSSANNNSIGWSIAFAIAALVFVFASLLHSYGLPKYSPKSSSDQLLPNDAKRKSH